MDGVKDEMEMGKGNNELENEDRKEFKAENDTEMDEEGFEGLTDVLYAEDKKPGKNGIRFVGNGELSDGNGETGLRLTEQDRKTLGKIRDLAAETPVVIGTLLRDVKTPAVVKVKIIDMIWDRAFGKPEATVNLNGNGRSLEASEMRVEALVRSIRMGEELDNED